MKTFFIVVFFSVFGVAGSSYAQDKISIVCKSDDVNCPARIIACDSKRETCHGTAYSGRSDLVPPLPPVPPTPPGPPGPPAPPKIVIPVEAHLACVGKKTGTEITWEFEKKSRVTGTCREHNGKAYLQVSRWHIENTNHH